MADKGKYFSLQDLIVNGENNMIINKILNIYFHLITYK